MFYTAKRMTDVLPVVFQAWKEISFENKATNIHKLLSAQRKDLSIQ